ncbi:UDP-Glc:alpha-D-GlcNAc-diphosphoundecaprenol beta-1,3-glucosyltransferase WfgD [Methylacidimicrobium cyclopophantes]|uniref:UDP-Glc:alpha-D-GlcNAc-diphosphoundecaprenol beta-1,3-glucosyltransferase WfgD n=1 Tax=Methylacidimicrobium cyclopophantes TaxID=1041766 RepID=A0A5E6MDF4_9BACT|nr:glycosyltransferase family 2 protein [Methylacidimicrobium cyclopophantes]VVM07000.1 UDP-Glc:alpha-D-GlcNAc-diphosphoundecaprenol beta-1,3-glucosyltransferase WfgD [Methylacidimicrobium cyclopophantes]
MPLPLVSIGIPTHNGADTVAAAVESALAQSWPRIEVLVLDDGSADGTRERLQAFLPHIRLLTQPNQGRASARNALLAAASGRWIQWLDQDDLLLPRKIETQLEEAHWGEDADLIYSPCLLDEGSGSLRPQPPCPEERLLSGWFSGELPQTGGYLWRSEAVKRLGGWSNRAPLFDDYELVGRAIRQGLRFRLSPTPGAVWRIRRGPIAAQRTLIFARQKAGVLEEMARWLDESRGWTAPLRRSAGEAFFLVARWLARSGEGREAESFFGQASARGWIRPPTNPFYRILLDGFGFSRAERVAKVLRRLRFRPSTV